MVDQLDQANIKKKIKMKIEKKNYAILQASIRFADRPIYHLRMPSKYPNSLPSQFITISSINHYDFYEHFIKGFFSLLFMSIPALIDNGEMVTKLLNYRVFLGYKPIL
ncbi:hypothetical protein BpHYR1_049352 [Brachionus plicatilis]|uniref:Uncharacterized protein n=1 Tax=Brachionus plicatilis TaxID=10195 RepID=A0A3M7SK61_BRAPC|nr:hypothetical protein BpHYR1_049352 [Brachionus plicatilis]